MNFNADRFDSFQPYLRAARISYYTWNLTIRYTWNCCFYIVAIVFLYAYKAYFLADSLYFKQNGQNYYRSYENLLFFTSQQRCSLFNSINFILIAFYVVDMLYVLNENHISDAINKFFACGIVICFDIYRYKALLDSRSIWEKGHLYLPNFTFYVLFRLQIGVFFGDV